MNILLDYFFPITAIDPTPAASTAFLKQVVLVVSPKMGVTTGVITGCTSNSAIAALTDNTEGGEFFSAGMSKVYILPMDNLDLVTALDGHESDFYTLVVSSDFDKDDVTLTQASGVATVTSYANLVSGTADTVTVAGVTFTAQGGAATPGAATFQAATSNNATAASLAAQINAHVTAAALVIASVNGAIVTIKAVASGYAGNTIGLSYTDHDSNIGITLSGLSTGDLSGGSGLFLGTFKGVVGVSSTDDTYLATQAAIYPRTGMHTTSGNKAGNLCFAFGKLLSNALDWLNQQYVSMPLVDDVDTVGDANSLFDSKISFVISDTQFGERLALFACGGKAIVEPYIKRNLEIDMQSAGLQYISGNMPAYTKTQAALLEDELQKVLQSYIDRKWIDAGTVTVTLDQDNFVASSSINIAEPKALWRIFGEIQETL